MKNFIKYFGKTMAVLLAFAVTLAYMPAAAKVSLAKKSKGQVISVKITNKSKLKSMYEGDTKKISVSVKKKGKVSTKVTYKVANKKILTVNKKGKITAKKAGKTTVTVISAANKKKKDSISITVKRHFEFENDAVSFSGQAGDKIKLGSEDDDDNLYALSFNTEGVDLSWKSSDTNVVKVSNKGSLQIVGEGEAIITVGDKSTKETASVSVTITLSEDDEDDDEDDEYDDDDDEDDDEDDEYDDDDDEEWDDDDWNDEEWDDDEDDDDDEDEDEDEDEDDDDDEDDDYDEDDD